MELHVCNKIGKMWNDMTVVILLHPCNSTSYPMVRYGIR